MLHSVTNTNSGTTVYEEVHYYEDLKEPENKDKIHNENNEVSEKIYVSLQPSVMDTIRDHLQSEKSSYQNVLLPEPVYDYVYTTHGKQPKPVQLKNVKNYIDQIQDEIGKFKEAYQVMKYAYFWQKLNHQ